MANMQQEQEAMESRLRQKEERLREAASNLLMAEESMRNAETMKANDIGAAVNEARQRAKSMRDSMQNREHAVHEELNELAKNYVRKLKNTAHGRQESD